MQMSRVFCIPVFIALAFAQPYASADDAIDTDGPDFVDSSEVVDKGHFQFETEFQSERNKSSALVHNRLSTPTLLRYGFADTVEARIETDGRVRTLGASAPAESGIADTVVGLKWH